MRHGFQVRLLYPKRTSVQPGLSVFVLGALIILSVFSYLGAYAQDLSPTPSVLMFQATSGQW